MHKNIKPAILYLGTPVVLVSTCNADGTVNLAPISSIWWLGWSSMIGVDGSSQTTENIRRTGECVLNLPSVDLVESINKIAKTTGRRKVPLHKKALGYRYEPDKFEASGLTMQDSVCVSAPRVQECQIQLEAKLSKMIPFGEKSKKMSVPTAAFELSIEQVHVEESILVDAERSYIDPDKWHPLIMSFRKFYSTGDFVYHSKLSEGPENQYAPWKQRGLKRRLTEWVLSRNTKKYKDEISGESEVL